MAVITRYIIVRHGIELDQVFEDKKLAEAYDNLLDAAENLAAFIKQGDLGVDIDAETIDAIAIHLAKNAPEVNRILKGIKPMKPAAGGTAKPEPHAAPSIEEDKKRPGRKSGPKPGEK
jgi:dsDNA-binding SOS-regulon protein